jgi:hypothetical protein
MNSRELRQEHAAYAAANMANAAEQQARMYAEDGTHLAIVTKVHVVDGYRYWPGTLAKALVARPELSGGTRQDMADLIQSELRHPDAFPPTRLSKPLSDKARHVVASILTDAMYDASGVSTGVSIRDAVKAGKQTTSDAIECAVSTTLHADGVSFNEKNKFYPYAPVTSYDDRPWYRLGIQVAGQVLPMTVVLAMRGLGIQQYQEADAKALAAASTAQRDARAALIRAGETRVERPLWNAETDEQKDTKRQRWSRELRHGINTQDNE